MTNQHTALQHVTRQFGDAEAAIVALDDVTWRFEQGTFTAVMGPSGSGKSTLLQVAAGLLSPSTGQVWLGGDRIDQLPERTLAARRRDNVGFVFQQFNLLPALTARENIMLPLRLARRPVEPDWFADITRRAGIVDRLDHLPSELSGGQQQRVALCRALITRPHLICADEPTGALDIDSAREVMRPLRHAVDRFGQTVVLVTHDPVVAASADRVILLVDGRIADILDHDRPSGDARDVPRPPARQDDWAHDLAARFADLVGAR